ncbi:MAG: exo-alpha-sialidase [Micrococcales bacterium]|nr:exo-alpha-sialidase [Micrococcales bacterium]
MTTIHTRARRRLRPALAVAAVIGLAVVGAAAPAQAVTIGNGALVYSPAAGTSFNPEGGRAAGTTYAKMILLKNSGTLNGTQIVTFDQLVLENGVQVYPIYRSTDNGTSWTRIAAVKPSTQFPTLTRTAQPALYETPIQLGSMPAGTLLLTGMIMPQDRSSSRLVMYKSLDHGVTWSFVSTIDTGGPATYDPSPTSTTSTVWEPSVNVDANGGLQVYFSDERQKASNVLQAVAYRRSTDGGLTWGSEVNVSAPTNKSDRPGMITVTRMGNGSYIATYEVVNRPSQSNNTAPVYFKISTDGITWPSTTSIGTAITLPDGRGIGSSPEVRWVPTGGANGTVIVSSKWALTPSGAIDGGQNFYVNTNYASGSWQRLPYPVTYDASDTRGGTFSGFAQGFDTSVDGKTIYQSTNVENLTTTYNDVRVGSLPLGAPQYEAESAARSSDTQLVTQGDAQGGQKVGYINTASSYVTFTVNAPAAGTYTVNVRYDNGSGGTSTHNVSIDGGSAFAVTYPKTVDYGRFQWAQFTATLSAGAHTLKFTKGSGFAELDQIQVFK